MPIAHACFVLDRVRMAGPSYAGLGSGSGLVGEGSSELGSELQNCWVAFEHAGDGGCFFGEPSASSSSGSVSESSSYGRTASHGFTDRQDRITCTNVAKTCLTLVLQTPSAAIGCVFQMPQRSYVFDLFLRITPHPGACFA